MSNFPDIYLWNSTKKYILCNLGFLEDETKIKKSINRLEVGYLQLSI